MFKWVWLIIFDREKPQQVTLLQEEGGEGEGGTLLGIADLDNEVDVR